MRNQSNLSVRIPQTLRRQVDELSEREERPLSDIVRDSLQRYVAVRKFELLRKKTLPFAESQGFLTDEDVFKAIS
ncbi:MAG TPA: ribbon-helix-helix protein, CopG family [Lacipirellulaceae bacterium]